jgi:tetratricopeptide (TPR) repeat protein
VTTQSHETDPQMVSSLDQALTAFHEALELIDPAESPGFYGVVLHDIAEAHKTRGDVREATERYRESVKHKLLAENSIDLCRTLIAFGDFLVDRSELTEARTILDQARDLLAKEAASRPRAVLIHRLGQVYEQLGNEDQEGAYTEAIKAYELALGLVDATTDPGSYATVLRDIGDVHKAEGRLADSVVAYEKAVEHMRRQPDAQQSVARLLVDLGRVLRQMGELQENAIADNED